MGIFAEAVKAALIQKNKRIIDVVRITKGGITQAALSSFLAGTVPRTPIVIDRLSKALGLPPEYLREQAVRDILERALGKYEVSEKAIVKNIRESSSKRIKLKIFNEEHLKTKLSITGAPDGIPDMEMEIAKKYGENAYGVLFSSDYLKPRIIPGEIAIMTGNFKRVPTDDLEEYGLVCVDDQLYIGRVMSNPHYIIVETREPHKIYSFAKRVIRFYHRVVAIFSQ